VIWHSSSSVTKALLRKSPNLPRRSNDVNTLTRPRGDRWIAGVCSGLGRRFGLSPGIVRLIFIVSCVLPGPQFLIYLALWLVMPSE
jgi:phage shock protein PspC (stress-responsive transcriptional regulator)